MGTNPNLSQGQVLTAGQWNALFVSKQDNLNFVPLNIAGGTLTGPLITAASVALAAGFNIPPGSAPSLPNIGDIWNLNGQLFIQGPTASIAVNEYQGATLQIGRLTPAGTNNGTAGAMMGLGGTCTITPLYSSRLLISVDAAVTNGTAGTPTIKLCFGSGTAPANGASGTAGSLVGGQLLTTIAVNAGSTPFHIGGIVTGLTAGVPYWVDLNVISSAGVTSVITSSVTVTEL